MLFYELKVDSGIASFVRYVHILQLITGLKYFQRDKIYELIIATSKVKCVYYTPKRKDC